MPFFNERLRCGMLFAALLACTAGVQLAQAQTRTHAVSQSPSPAASPAPSPMPTVDATQVAADAIQLNQRLRSLPERLVSNESLTDLDQRVNALRQATSDKAQQ